jgi:glycosyltransferase involved in cell wall biosynthesis
MAVSPTHLMSRPRVLLVAEVADPDGASVPLVGWSHARALARVADAHLVTQVRSRDAILRAGLREGEEFSTIDSERLARPAWRFVEFVRGGSDKGWTTATAVDVVTNWYFEHLVWKRFAAQIRAREFDVVHRLTPLSPTTPSLLAGRCARAGVPFVLGPLNGGVPWPKGFGSERRREREWLSYVRDAYRFVPGYRATRNGAAAILVGSRDTLAQMGDAWRSKCVYIPENGYDPARFPSNTARSEAPPLRVVFVGRLVPYKGADMLLAAAAPLVREGRVRIDVIGDGPEMPALRELVAREGLGEGVEFAGWVPHRELAARMARAHVLGSPSVREFGGAVVLEAMALGVVPLVVDYGGPAELVTSRTGLKVALGTRAEVVAGVREQLTQLAGAPSLVAKLARAAQCRAATQFTWDAKAQQVLEVYRWVLGQRPDKPDFGVPFADPESLTNPAHPAECRLPGNLEDVVG